MCSLTVGIAISPSLFLSTQSRNTSFIFIGLWTTSEVTLCIQTVSNNSGNNVVCLTQMTLTMAEWDRLNDRTNNWTNYFRNVKVYQSVDVLIQWSVLSSDLNVYSMRCFFLVAMNQTEIAMSIFSVFVW